VYPVKSCGPIVRSSIGDSANVTVGGTVENGGVLDLQLMLIDAESRKFLSQRVTHRLQGNGRKGFPSLSTVAAEATGSPGLLRLTASGAPHHEVMLHGNGDTASAQLFGQDLEAQDLGDDVADWFREFTGANVRLVHRVNTRSEARWPIVGPSGTTQFDNSFADAGAILLANEASVTRLNEWLRVKGKPPVEMSRFRPNLVLRDAEAFQEDEWLGKNIRIGAALFRVDGPCGRCSVVTTTQSTGVVDDSPYVLHTLRRNRPSEAKRGLGPDQSPEFGLHLTPLSDAEVSVGDAIEIC